MQYDRVKINSHGQLWTVYDNMKECNELLQFRWQNVGGNILLPLSFNVVRLKLTFISSGFVFYYMFLLTVQNRGSLDVSLRDYQYKDKHWLHVSHFSMSLIV